MKWKLFLIACVNVFFGKESKKVQRWCLEQRTLLHYECAQKHGCRCIVVFFDTRLKDHVFFYHTDCTNEGDKKFLEQQNPHLQLYQTIIW